ncbi:uncharacterized protein LOC141616848 [Silene latifolia]|uniref:uncharacterized protein LOC141616848 n=1 Tax=Silene latifolia TaxID=37657 RepID=UPI003D784262
MANSMAFPQLIAILAIAFAFSRLRLSSCSQVKGSVSCTDCHPDYDFSGIKVQVKCDQVTTISEAITDKTGHFETILPTDNSPTTNCWAELVGGPTQLYFPEQNTVSKLSVTLGDKNTFSQTTPLVFAKACKPKCQYKITQSSNRSSITVYVILPNGTTVTITDVNGTVTISNATTSVTTTTTTAQLYYDIP